MTEQNRQRSVWRTTLRVVATGLLLFAFADLSFPELCTEETGTLPSGIDAANISHAGESSDSAPGPSSVDDCFCCCSHVVSEPFAAPLGAADLLMAAQNTLPPAIRPAPARIPFHPPRLG